jgi:hypothetical protein
MKFNILFNFGGLMLLEAFAIAAPVACKRDNVVSLPCVPRSKVLTVPGHDWIRCRKATGCEPVVGFMDAGKWQISSGLPQLTIGQLLSIAKAAYV